MGVVRRYIDILTIIFNFPYSSCIRSFFSSSILTSLFIFKMFFRSLRIRIRNRNGDFYFARRAPKLRYYGNVIHSLILLEISRRTRWWCLKCVIVYLARDIRPFVMYCVNGKPRSSLLIESTTDTMIHTRREKDKVK